MTIKLEKGDKVEIIAPSSYIENNNEFFAGVEILKDWGLEVNYNNIIGRRFGYLAGDDNTRFLEIEKGQQSKIIIFAKGGWGSARLLERDPIWGDGWMLGFSDTCSLLLSKYSQGKLGSIHGPMISTLSEEPDWSLKRLKDFLFEGYVDEIKGTTLKEGTASGEIIVSNLSIMSFLVGTSHLPDLKGKIIVLEDVNEDLYKIDRMLTYLRMSKKLNQAAGLAFGCFFNKNENSFDEKSFRNLIIERFNNFNIPIVIDLPVGHIKGNACLPIGYKGILNGYSGSLSVG